MLPMRITGAGGAELSDGWASGPHAHVGMSVPASLPAVPRAGDDEDRLGGTSALADA